MWSLSVASSAIRNGSGLAASPSALSLTRESAISSTHVCSCIVRLRRSRLKYSACRTSSTLERVSRVSSLTLASLGVVTKRNMRASSLTRRFSSASSRSFSRRTRVISACVKIAESSPNKVRNAACSANGLGSVWPSVTKNSAAS